MLKFFRSIRRQLLHENPLTGRAGKTSKYFRYAIGEIMLVVLGILIALQINNWNEARKQNMLANDYRRTLMNDLIEDTTNIAERIVFARGIQKSIDAYFEYFDQGDNSLENLIDSIRKTDYALYRYHSINYTFTSMQSSGKLGLLTEEERRALMELSNVQKQVQIVFEKVITAHFNFTNKRDDYWQNDKSDLNFYEVVGLKQTRDDLALGLKYFHQVLNNNYALNNEMIWRGNQITEMSKKIIVLLESESEKN